MTTPRTLAEIRTPALVVDLPAMERNIRRMAAFFAGTTCKLRPHFKAHKTPEIAIRQLAAGSCVGLTCATVAEAEIAAQLCDDILLANEIVDAGSCARFAALAREVDVTIAIDSMVGVEQMAAAATRAGVRVGALVDVNVGQNRCGVPPGPASHEALLLAQRIAETPSLQLRGLMGYEGHACGVEDRAQREAQALESMEQLLATATMFREAGLPTDIVSAGGTGTYDITSRFEGITEIQAGSYALMDTYYARFSLPFEEASIVLGTVISRPAADRCVTDSGHKWCTKDHGYPSVKGIAGASVVALNDEHATISIPASCPVKVGDRIGLLPSHTDPTVNLHDVMYVVDGDTVVGVWPVGAGPKTRS